MNDLKEKPALNIPKGKVLALLFSDEYEKAITQEKADMILELLDFDLLIDKVKYQHEVLSKKIGGSIKKNKLKIKEYGYIIVLNDDDLIKEIRKIDEKE